MYFVWTSDFPVACGTITMFITQPDGILHLWPCQACPSLLQGPWVELSVSAHSHEEDFSCGPRSMSALQGAMT